MDIRKMEDYITYNPETGVMTWKKVLGNRTRAGAQCGANVDSKKYGRVCFDGRHYRAHRVAWALFYKELPPEQIDHINGNRLDNRIANLRAANNAENSRNAQRGKNNTSGVVGVTWHRAAKKWVAQLMFNRRTKYLGLFENIEDAAKARRQAELQYFGQFSKTASATHFELV
jgi:hypothetical protein